MTTINGTYANDHRGVMIVGVFVEDGDKVLVNGLEHLGRVGTIEVEEELECVAGTGALGCEAVGNELGR